MELKQGYKQTELGLIPEDWKLSRLCDVSILKSGKSITSARIFETGEYKCFGGNGLRGYSDSFTHDGSFPLIGRQGALCGNVNYINGKFFASEHAVVVTVSRNVDPKWMTYVLIRMNLNQYSESSAQPGLSVNKINILPIAFPPTIEEQSAIATALSDIDELISQTEKLIDKKKAIKQGVMHELLKPKEGWVTKKLGDIFEIEKGTQLNRSTLDSSSEFPVYNGGIAPSGFTSSFNTKENTIIISEGGNSCGFVNYIKTKFWRGGHCYELRPNNYLNKHFAYFLLKYNEAEIMALRVGSGLPNIQRSNLAKYHIKFPDLNEQKLISEILTDLQNSFDLLNVKLQKLKRQKQGMMQTLLTGKIRLI